MISFLVTEHESNAIKSMILYLRAYIDNSTVNNKNTQDRLIDRIMLIFSYFKDTGDMSCLTDFPNLVNAMNAVHVGARLSADNAYILRKVLNGNSTFHALRGKDARDAAAALEKYEADKKDGNVVYANFRKGK